MTARNDHGRFCKCPACGGKRYLISTRDDGREAVERCDNCAWYGDNDPRTISDIDAAKLAQADGMDCESTYPCYVRESK